MSFEGFPERGHHVMAVYDSSIGSVKMTTKMAGGHGFANGAWRRSAVGHVGMWPEGAGYTQITYFEDSGNRAMHGLVLHPDNQSWYVPMRVSGGSGSIIRLGMIGTNDRIKEYSFASSSGEAFDPIGIAVSEEESRIYTMGNSVATPQNRLIAMDLDLNTIEASVALGTETTSTERRHVLRTRNYIIAQTNLGVYRLPLNFTSGSTPDVFVHTGGSNVYEIYYDGVWIWISQQSVSGGVVQAFDPDDLTTIQAEAVLPNTDSIAQGMFFDGVHIWCTGNLTGNHYRWAARDWWGSVLTIPTLVGGWGGLFTTTSGKLWWDGVYIRKGMYRTATPASLAIGTLDPTDALADLVPIEGDIAMGTYGFNPNDPLARISFLGPNLIGATSTNHVGANSYRACILYVGRPRMIGSKFTSTTEATGNLAAGEYAWARGRLAFENYSLDLDPLGASTLIANVVPTDRRSILLTGNLTSARELIASEPQDPYGFYVFNDATDGGGGSVTLTDSVTAASVGLPFGGSAIYLPGGFKVL